MMQLLMTVVLGMTGPGASRPWPGERTSLESAAGRTTTVVVGVAKGKVEVVERHAAHLSTGMATGKGEVIRGGGIVFYADCRQKFEVTDVLHGKAKAEERVLTYTIVEKAEGFPLPSPEQALPDGAKAILLLREDGSLVKALPDTPENRKLVRAALEKKPEPKK
jgi:hypothetical protein